MTLRATAAAAILALGAGPVAAHGTLQGGGFLSGALHPLVAVEHLVLLIGLGLLSGRLPPERRGAGFAAVGLGLLAGLAGSRGLLPAPSPTSARVAILVLAGLAGGVLALSPRRLPAALVPGLAALAGLVVGLDTDAGGEAGAMTRAQAAGVAVGVYLVVLDAAALAAWAVRPPFPIAVRVAGSWIAAIALMLLALALAPERAMA